MKEIGAGIKRIFREEKGLLVLMLVLFLMGGVLVTHTLLHFSATGARMYIRYSDMSGYKTGGWNEMIIFPILGVILGVLHNLFAIQVFQRRGRGYAIALIIISMLIATGAFVLLLRLLEEI